jgi:hypothetical protein
LSENGSDNRIIHAHGGTSNLYNSDLFGSNIYINRIQTFNFSPLYEYKMVYGYNEDGEVVVLREGTNDLVCIADNPYNKGIQTSCYFKELDPFMKRGRELKKEGKGTMDVRKMRGEEVASGKLKMPEAPSMMYIFYGSEETYDKTKATLGDGQFRYVIYTPFATAESTGLPLKPHAKGMPWLMDPGSHRAHIMVGPN